MIYGSVVMFRQGEAEGMKGEENRKELRGSSCMLQELSHTLPSFSKLFQRKELFPEEEKQVPQICIVNISDQVAK